MSSWCYGLVREKGKLRVCEVHWEGKKPEGYCYVRPRKNYFFKDFGEIVKDFHLIVSDILSQIKNHHIIEEREFESSHP